MLVMLAACLAAGAGQTPQEAKPDQADPKMAPVVIPKDTPLKLALQRPLSDQHSKLGDNVLYGLAENVTDSSGKIVLLKAGTPVVGKVTAKQGWNISHWIALIGFSADSLAISDGDNTTVIPVHIKESQHNKYHDFRTRHSLAPPKATKAELDAFKAKQQPIVDRLLTAIDSTRGHPEILLSPFTADGAVVIGKVVDLGQAPTILPQLANNDAVRMVKNIHSAKDVTGLARVLGSGTAMTLIGFGVGLWELFDIVRGLFQHVSIASGTVFDAYTTEDTQIMIPVTPDQSRGPWHMHVIPAKPIRFARAHNVEIPVPDPWLRKHRRHSARRHT